MSIRSLVVVLVLGLCAGGVRAQEEPVPKPAADGAGDAAKPFKAVVKLKSGGQLTGTVASSNVWERLDPQRGWVPCERTDAGASVRVVGMGGGQQGTIVIDAKLVENVENLGPVTEADLKRAEADAAAAAKRAGVERERLKKEAEIKRQARAVEEARKAEQDAERKKAEEEAARIRADEELLKKFPPGEKWHAKTIEEVERRALILHVMPTDEEREFMRVYPEWSRALAAKKAAEEQAAAERAAREKEAAKPPVPEKK